MHIPDGFLNAKLATGLLAVAMTALAFCFSKVVKAVTVLAGAFATADGSSLEGRRLVFNKDAKGYFAKMAMIAIWVFAAQMFNIPIASATSAHLIGGVFAAILMGPFAGALIVSSVLIVQCLFFADGGLFALGANILNMALIGSFAAYYVYKLFEKFNYYLAVLVSCVFSVMGAALACLIELWLSHTIAFGAAFKDMMSLHLIFAGLETAITLALLKTFKFLDGGK